MLTSEKASEAARAAVEFASEFVKYLRDHHGLTVAGFFDGKLGARNAQLAEFAAVYVRLKKDYNCLFPSRHGVEDAALPKTEHASWLLYGPDDEFSAILSSSQMNNWYAITGLPVQVQTMRSIVHEMAHLLFSEIRGTTGYGFVQPVTVEEEEFAWVFVFMFFAILLGEYTRLGRIATPERDNTPGVQI